MTKPTYAITDRPSKLKSEPAVARTMAEKRVSRMQAAGNADLLIAMLRERGVVR